MRAFEAARRTRWGAADAAVRALDVAWEGTAAADVPRRIGPRIDRALRALRTAVDGRERGRASRAAIEVGQWALDLQLRYRPVAEVDIARFDLWCAQVIVDAAARDARAVNGDAFTLDYIRDRMRDAVSPEDLTRINTAYMELQVAASQGELRTAARAAERLRGIIASL